MCVRATKRGGSFVGSFASAERGLGRGEPTRLDSLRTPVLFGGMSEPSPVTSLARLLQSLGGPEIPCIFWEEDDLQDLASAESALLAFRSALDQSDPRLAQTDMALAGLKYAVSLDFDTHHIGYDDHQAAFEWIQERKAEAIKVLTPASTLLDEAASRESPSV